MFDGVMPALKEGTLSVRSTKSSETRNNARSKHVVGGVHLVGTDDRVKEVNKILVLLVRWTIASDVES